jgi:transposase-like protein
MEDIISTIAIILIVITAILGAIFEHKRKKIMFKIPYCPTCKAEKLQVKQRKNTKNSTTYKCLKCNSIYIKWDKPSK